MLAPMAIYIWYSTNPGVVMSHTTVAFPCSLLLVLLLITHARQATFWKKI